MLLASLAIESVSHISTGSQIPALCLQVVVCVSSILQVVVNFNLFHQMLLYWQICSKMDRLYHKDRQGSFGATIRSSHQNHPLVLTNVFFKFLRIPSNMVGSSPGLSCQIFILLIFIDDNWWTLFQV
jgi:hypothetical protein